jgi:hypothetical protein
MFDPLPDFPKARSKNWANVMVKTISTPSSDEPKDLSINNLTIFLSCQKILLLVLKKKYLSHRENYQVISRQFLMKLYSIMALVSDSFVLSLFYKSVLRQSPAFHAFRFLPATPRFISRGIALFASFLHGDNTCFSEDVKAIIPVIARHDMNVTERCE